MRAVAIALLALLAADSARAGDALWTVAIVGRRDVVMTLRQDGHGAPSADAHLLAPDLSLAVSNRNGVVAIRDSNGVEWQTADGSLRLDGPIGSRSLSSPVLVKQDAVFLPLDAVATLAGRTLVVEERGRARLVPSALPSHASTSTVAVPTAASATNAAATAPTSPAVVGTGAPATAGAAGDVRGPQGWDFFSLPKTLEERRASAREDDDLLALRDRPAAPEIQPSNREAFGLEFGTGWVSNGGGALELLGSGSIAGYQLSAAGFLTGGPHGASVRSGRVSLDSPSGGWTTEAGDLLSEMRGLGSGVRVSRRITSRWRPGLSLYVNDWRVRGDRSAVAYRDSILVTRNIDLRGEVASDGSRFAAARVIAGRGSIDTFYRYSPERRTTDGGLSLSYSLWHGVTAYGGTRRSIGASPERWSMAGVALPLMHGSSISFEESRTSRQSTDDTARTFGLQLPFGPLRMMQRYTWTDVALLDAPSSAAFGRRQLQSMASWSPSPRLRFTYQLGTQWLAGSDARQWTELESVLRLSSRTSLQAVTGFPSVTDRQRLRVGLQQTLAKAFRLSVEYGRLPAFQSRMAAAPDISRLLVMVRHSVTVRTPAAGTTVEGFVRDDNGAAVAGAVVALGRYMTTTRTDGRYHFDHVPAGEHALSLVYDRLPAAYSADVAEQVLRLAGGMRNVQADLAVRSLRALHGRVYIDRNSNGRMDEGEGQGGVVVRLDDNGTATMTDDEGAFAFYNLEPGRYAVWIEGTRLKSGLALVSTARRIVNLEPDAAVTNLDFELATRDKPIVFKEQP